MPRTNVGSGLTGIHFMHGRCSSPTILSMSREIDGDRECECWCSKALRPDGLNERGFGVDWARRLHSALLPRGSLTLSVGARNIEIAQANDASSFSKSPPGVPNGIVGGKSRLVQVTSILNCSVSREIGFSSIPTSEISVS